MRFTNIMPQTKGLLQSQVNGKDTHAIPPQSQLPSKQMVGTQSNFLKQNINVQNKKPTTAATAVGTSGIANSSHLNISNVSKQSTAPQKQLQQNVAPQQFKQDSRSPPKFF